MSQTPDTNQPADAADEVILSGSTWKAIWQMSWPTVLYMSTISLANFVEVWVAGRLGSDVQAAIGLGGQIWFFMIMLTVALSAGTTALVSRFWGARDHQTGIEAARQSLYFACIFGLSSAVLSIVICRPLLKLLGASAAVQQLGWDYLKFDLLSHIPLTIMWVGNAIFRAKGNARVPMITMGLVSCTVGLLDLVLCFWPFHYGISAFGFSWFIASCIGVVLTLTFLRQSDIGACVDFKGFFTGGISRSWLMRIMKIGMPACIQDLSWVGGNFALFLIFAYLANPTACQAAWAISLRIEEVLSAMPVYALGTAVATIVGQNLGAKNPQRATRAGWQTAALAVAYNTVIAFIMFVFARPMAELMSTNAAVIEYSTSAFQIIGLSEPFIALEIVLIGAMQGAGYTKWPMAITVIFLFILKLPLAWFLAVQQNLGIKGVWLSMALCATCIGLLCAWRFKQGAWKAQEV